MTDLHSANSDHSDAAPRMPASDAETGTSADPEVGQRENAEESTIGTGTSIALGCIAGTILLVIIGLIFLIIVMVVT